MGLIVALKRPLESIMVQRSFFRYISMKNIDLTITSVVRPDLLEKVLESFSNKTFFKSRGKYQINAILNIDPIGDPEYSFVDVMDVVTKFYPYLYANNPLKPNFSKAVQWVWSNSSADYVFHLEDMWIFRDYINLEIMVDILNNHPRIACVNLHKVMLADGSPEPNFYKNYKDKKYRRLFLQIEKPLLSPGLWRGEFVRNFAKIMNDEDNPELQLWGDKKMARDGMASKEIKDFLNQWDYSIYAANWKLPFWKCSKQAVSLAEGRKWKRSKGFYKENPWAPWKKVYK